MQQTASSGLRQRARASMVFGGLAIAAGTAFAAGHAVSEGRPAADPQLAMAAAPRHAVTAPDRLAALAERLRLAPERRGRAFAIVDKPTAMLFVYRADGRLAGASPVLLGRTLGDDTVPGTGERSAAGRLRDDDLTTPAGRFVSEPGRNLDGETVVWLDYDNAFAIHRVRPGVTQATRLQRLESPRSAERRVSAGCVVAPVDFYEAVVEPLLGRSAAWVVVTREDGAWQAPMSAPTPLASAL